MFRGHVPGGAGGEDQFPQTPRVRILLGQDHDSKPRGSGSCWPRIITQNPKDQDPAGPGLPLKTPRIRALLAPKAEFGTGPRRRSGGLGLRRGSTTWPPTGPRRLTGAKGRTGFRGEQGNGALLVGERGGPHDLLPSKKVLSETDSMLFPTVFVGSGANLSLGAQHP